MDLYEYVAEYHCWKMKDQFTRDCEADVLKRSLHFRPYRQELLPVAAGEGVPVTWFLVGWCHSSQSQWQKFSSHKH